MKKKLIPAEELTAAWRKDPEYVKAYEALEEEYAIASALIRARSEAGMTQEEVARRMGTTATVVSRMERGRTMPSTRSLERFAAATGHSLRISFERKRRGSGARRSRVETAR